MIRQAIIFIHGVGDQGAGYSDEAADLIEENVLRYINKHLKNERADNTNIVYREVLWAPVTARVQKTLWQRIKRGPDLDCTKMRRFMMDFAGDAIAYQKQDDRSIYEAIHDKVREQVDLVFEEFPDDDVEFTIVAHSLGSVIASNYLFDCCQELTATNFFTLGSPLAIWLLGEGDVSKADAPVQIQKPHGVWINILDDEDILGYPLRNINQHYYKAVDRDIVTEIGGLLHRGPISHKGYWTDRDVVKPIAIKLGMDYFRINRNIPFKRNAYFKALNRWRG